MDKLAWDWRELLLVESWVLWVESWVLRVDSYLFFYDNSLIVMVFVWVYYLSWLMLS